MPDFRVFRSFLNFAVLVTALFAIVFLNSCSFKKNIRNILSHLETEIPYQKTSHSIAGSCKNPSLECAFNTEEPNLFTGAKKSKKTEKTFFLQQKIGSVIPLTSISGIQPQQAYTSPILDFPLFIIHSALLL